MTQEDILNNPEKYDLSIETVGTGTLKSPMKGVPFVSESERVSLTADVGRIQDFCKRGIEIPSLEAAGPRETIFHDPAWTRAGIVTCGGLCPGLNNVIKGLVQVLWFDYGVRNIFGIPYGYRGLNPAYGSYHPESRCGGRHPGRRRYHSRKFPRQPGREGHGRHPDAPEHQRAVLHRR